MRRLSKTQDSGSEVKGPIVFSNLTHDQGTLNNTETLSHLLWFCVSILNAAKPWKRGVQWEVTLEHQNPLSPSSKLYHKGTLELNIMQHLSWTMESKQYFLIQNDVCEDQKKKTYLAEDGKI